MTIAEVEFYDNIYTSSPRKWTNVDRDYTAFKALSEYVNEPGRMLDYGCGNGHTLAFFWSQWPDTVYTGVDISDVALELTEKRVPGIYSFKELPDGMWDAITIMGVAEHFKAPAAELGYIAKHLSPDGYLYLEVPNCLVYSNNGYEGFRQTTAGSGQNEWHWRRDTWEQMIEEAGLEIVKSYTGSVPAWEYIWITRRRE